MSDNTPLSNRRVRTSLEVAQQTGSSFGLAIRSRKCLPQLAFKSFLLLLFAEIDCIPQFVFLNFFFLSASRTASLMPVVGIPPLC